MKKRQLIILIPLIALLANGIAYLIVKKGRTPTADLATVAGPPAARPSPAVEPAAGVAVPNKGEESERARARRAVGLAALEAGEYDKALANFVAAREISGEDSHVGELIRVTEELLHNGGPKARPRIQVARAEAPRPAPRGGGSRRSAAREAAPSPEPAETVVSAPATGTLIVTSTPRGLLVRVDDSALDLTPMRAAISPGSHRVALLDGDRKVYETTLSVREGEVSTLMRDLSSEVAAESQVPGAASAGGAKGAAPSSLAALSEKPSPPAPVPAAAAVATPRALPAVRSSAVPTTGTLAISSPGLYGVVWINGRPRGYPPLEVTDLPVGPAKIEVRVNGIEKRSSTVVVERERTVSVTLRSDNKAR